MDRRLVLSEDGIEDVGLILPEDDALIISDDIVPEVVVDEPEVKDEIIVNAYSDLLQDLLRKQWDVINAADAIIATIDTESSEINKEDVKAILGKLVDDTTVSIGMVTKALGTVDPSQEELMDQGIEKAEEVITQEPIEESIEKTNEIVEKHLKEDFNEEFRKIDFSNEEYWRRYWLEESLYQFDYITGDTEYFDFDEENEQLFEAFLESLTKEDIEDILTGCADELGDDSRISEVISEDAYETVYNHISNAFDEFKKSINPVDLEHKEGE